MGGNYQPPPPPNFTRTGNFERLRLLEEQLTTLITQEDVRLWCVAYREVERDENVFEVIVVKNGTKMNFYQSFKDWKEVPNNEIISNVLLLAG